MTAPEEASLQAVPLSDERSTAGGERAIGMAALILMAANLFGSVLGYARSAIIVAVFGETRGTDAFLAASLIPQMFYDLTIGAAVSAALIPVFTEIADRQGRRALAQTSGAVLALAWLVLAVVVALLVALAHPLMTLLLARNHQHLDPAAIDLAIRIVRILVPSLLFLGSSAVLLATLYSIRRFTVSAFAPACYHLGIIAAALILARPLGILALPIGAVAGAAAQTAVQVPSLLRYLGGLHVRIELSPPVRRILRLYLPVAAGLLISLVGQGIDIGFKWELGRSAVTAMNNATILTQFPIGIAVAGLSFAILPAISADASFGRLEDYKGKIASGMRLALFLSIPAAIGYLALATPICALLFQHHRVTPADTSRTAAALLGYAIQIPFVAIDQLLIFAFYARKNTITPMLVGVIGVGIYYVSARLLLPHLHILGLALANTLQNSLHGLILLAILLVTIGPLTGTGLFRGVGKTCLAAVAMAGGVLALATLLGAPPHAHAARQLLDAAGPIMAGGIVYLGAARLLRSAELQLLTGLLAERLRPLRP